MAIKPILFSSHMVRAILDGRKTVTRRVVKPQPEGVKPQPEGRLAFCSILGRGMARPRRPDKGRKEERMWNWKAPCNTGDILYVRETWAQVNGVYYYRADDIGNLGVFGGWCPSIHMPKEAARIFLRVKNVRVERLHDMHEEDVRREGFENPGDFIRLWGSTIKPADRGRYGWEANPFVWVIEFERCEKPEQCDD